jgi:predicted nucleic-acid-binding Zn-ribbon protein
MTQHLENTDKGVGELIFFFVRRFPLLRGPPGLLPPSNNLSLAVWSVLAVTCQRNCFYTRLFSSQSVILRSPGHQMIQTHFPTVFTLVWSPVSQSFSGLPDTKWSRLTFQLFLHSSVLQSVSHSPVSWTPNDPDSLSNCFYTRLFSSQSVSQSFSGLLDTKWSRLTFQLFLHSSVLQPVSQSVSHSPVSWIPNDPDSFSNCISQ